MLGSAANVVRSRHERGIALRGVVLDAVDRFHLGERVEVVRWGTILKPFGEHRCNIRATGRSALPIARPSAPRRSENDGADSS